MLELAVNIFLNIFIFESINYCSPCLPYSVAYCEFNFISRHEALLNDSSIFHQNNLVRF